MAITNPGCGASHHYCQLCGQEPYGKIRVTGRNCMSSASYDLKTKPINGDAFWLWNMREQWAFVHNLQIQEVGEQKQNKVEQLAPGICSQVKPYCQHLCHPVTYRQLL